MSTSFLKSVYTIEGLPKKNNLILEGKLDVNGETTLDKTIVDTSKGNFVVTGNGKIGINTQTPKVKLDIQSTDAIKVPSGTTLERPTAPNTQLGQIRYNTTLDRYEGYSERGNLSYWVTLEGSWDNDLVTNTNSIKYYLRYDTSRIGIGTSSVNSKLSVKDPSLAQLELINDETSNKYVRFQVDNNGILKLNNYSNSGSTLYIDGNDSLRVPVGTTAERPDNAKVELGMIRYNSTLKLYEGYKDGEAWGSLGGVRDLDEDTFITVLDNDNETDIDKIRFFSSGTERAVIDEVGRVGIGLTMPADKLEVSGKMSCDNFRLKGTGTSNYVLVSSNDQGEASWRAPDLATYTNKQVIYSKNGTNYGDYNRGNFIHIPDLDHFLPSGRQNISVDWYSYFVYHSPGDQIFSLYYRTSPWTTTNPSDGTLVKKFYRSSNISGKYSFNGSVNLNIPESQTYYFRWFRSSDSNYFWTSIINFINEEEIKIDYITPVASGITGSTATGEINTASNVGISGKGIFKRKDNLNLEFKKIIGGSNVSLVEGSDAIIINNLGNSQPAFTGAGKMYSEYIDKKTLFKGGNFTISSSTSGEDTIINTSSAHSITANNLSNEIFVLIKNTSNADLDNKFHKVKSITDTDTIVIETKTTGNVTSGDLYLNYSNYVENTNINLSSLDYTLKEGDYYVFVSWTSKFLDRPLDDQKLELYYHTSEFADNSYNASMPVNTKLTTIFRSNANSDQHTTTESFHVNIPKGQKYYLRWVRSSEGPFDWGNNILQLQEESFKVSYIAPATNYWNLTQYTVGTVNYPVINFAVNDTNLGRVGIGITDPNTTLEVKGISSLEKIGIGTTIPSTSLDIVGDMRLLSNPNTKTSFLGRKTFGSTSGTINNDLFKLTTLSGGKGSVRLFINIEDTANKAIKFEEYTIQFRYNYISSTDKSGIKIIQNVSMETDSEDLSEINFNGTSLTSSTTGGGGGSFLITFNYSFNLSGSSLSETFVNYNIDYFGADKVSITSL